VLQGSDLGDIVVVVTRYFGGTKLGTGGLVRAYGDAVRAVLEVLPRAMRVSTRTIRVALPYALYERVQLLIEARHGQIVEQDFAEQVHVTARFATVQVAGFVDALRELSNGTLDPETVGSDGAAIVPAGALGTGPL
jgi:putative IMPACT (imprinted ancient) family translation regulator